MWSSAAVVEGIDTPAAAGSGGRREGYINKTQLHDGLDELLYPDSSGPAVGPRPLGTTRLWEL